MSTTTKPEPKPKIETKQLRHDFTDLEKAGMGGDLSRVIAGLRQTQNEADESKASFKAKITAAEAEVDRISTSLMNGWEFRMKRVRVVLRPKDKRKDYYLENAPADSKPILTEDMTNADFELDLIAAEARFDNREEICLFPPAGVSQGILVVGRFKGRWHTALRINIDNKHKEREE